MTSRFDSYEKTAIGQELAAIVMMPELVAEYCAMSRIGKPAVQACASDVAPIIEALPTTAERSSANQYVGWLVAKIMRSLGYELVSQRGRVSDGPYHTGAVWALRSNTVTLSHNVPSGISRRLQVMVKQGPGGVVADIDAIDSAGDPPRRVHIIVALNVPIADVRDKAVRYAERHGFGHIHVIDRARLADEELGI
ncbi:hypothetical protein X747_28760 [Mesorhizobium sp. LNJC384A00]|uniref:hypothetical protein n=1 Tax=Mesorhizobium sp. LNJC384A00 TaxID=1287268 RepID=UPI0003CDD4D1|nr:hypothetical protein [Mesorhizobium sp. LNJC384A00]ESY35298.1 hypothetical protein X747_28760 [Mesorhizobium sp. LNJC384A00]